MAATLPTIFYAFGGSLFSTSTPAAYQVVRANAAASAFEQVTIYSRSEADAAFASLGSNTFTGSQTVPSGQSFLAVNGGDWNGVAITGTGLTGKDTSNTTTWSINSATGVITGVGSGLTSIPNSATTATTAATATTIVLRDSSSGITAAAGAFSGQVTVAGGSTAGFGNLVIRSLDTRPGIHLYNANNYTTGGFLNGTWTGLWLCSNVNYNNGNWIARSTTPCMLWLDSGIFQFFADTGKTTGTTYTPTERARITSSGNLLVGTTTDDGVNKLQVSGSVSVFGSNPIRFNANSSTSTNREQSNFTPSFVVSTDASRTSRCVWNVFDTAEREAMRVEASGSAPMIGFYGSAATAKQTVTGSRGSNAALADLLTKLATLGLITDSTS